MNLVEKYYVGVREGTFDTKDFPLAFATPMGTDKAFAKRKTTVDQWCGPKGTGTIVDNEALEGFRFEKTVSRWSTSNKLFRINDPRGFTLEISAANLADIILNCTIEKGLIQEKLIWTRNESNNYLTRLNHPEYISLVQPKFNRPIQIGDKIESSYGITGVYLGKVYVNTVRAATEYKQNDGSWGEKYVYPSGRYNSYSGNTTRVVKKVEKDPKPWNIILKDQTYGKPLFLQRDISKCKILSTGHAIPIKLSYGVPTKDVDGFASSYSTTFVLFENKGDAVHSSIDESHYI